MHSINFSDIPSILLVLFIIYVSNYYYKYFTRENPLPGPIPLPLFGNISLIRNDIAVWPSQLQEKYGDFYEVYMGSKRMIWLCRDDLIYKMMKPSIRSNFHDLVSEEDEGIKEIGLLDSGVNYNLDYKAWEYYRRFFARTMSKQSFMVQSLHSVQQVFKEMESYWEQLGEDTVLDFPRWTKRYFTDATLLITASKPAYAMASYYNKISINKKAHVPESILKESDAFIEAVDDFIMCLMYFAIFPKFIRNFPGISGYTQKLKRQLSWLRDNVRSIVKARREEIERTPKDQELTQDILTMFLTINTSRDITEKIADSMHDQPMSDEEICGNFLETLGAGIDTAANSICFIVYYLSHYPKVRERLMEEFDRIFGKDANHQVTYEGIGKLEYCEAVIHECSRIFSTVPVMFKKNANPDEVGGLTFPANTKFYMNLQGIHKHKSTWTNPEEFNPERFMDKNNPNSKNSLYTFGGGLKKCPGRNLAILQLKSILAMLYRKYDIELEDMNAPIKTYTTAVRNCSELRIRVKKRKVII